MPDPIKVALLEHLSESRIDAHAASLAVQGTTSDKVRACAIFAAVERATDKKTQLLALYGMQCSPPECACHISQEACVRRFVCVCGVRLWVNACE
jgi:hypothetical protein